jgi:hypothetical protein
MLPPHLKNSAHWGGFGKTASDSDSCEVALELFLHIKKNDNRSHETATELEKNQLAIQQTWD